MSRNYHLSQHPVIQSINSGEEILVLISQDGELDDFHSLGASQTVFERHPFLNVHCFADIGSPEFVVSQDEKFGKVNTKQGFTPEQEEKEFKARRERAQQILPTASVDKGATSTKDKNEAYAASILKAAQEGKKIIIIHTGSFAPLINLMNKVDPGTLKNTFILSYASRNLDSALEAECKGQNPIEFSNQKRKIHQDFFKKVSISGAKLFLCEGFPILGEKNKISKEYFPLTRRVINHFDSEQGKWFSTYCVSSTKYLRERYAGYAKTLIEAATNALEDEKDPGKTKAKKDAQELLAELLSVLKQTEKNLDLSVIPTQFDFSSNVVDAKEREKNEESYKKIDTLIQELFKCARIVVGENYLFNSTHGEIPQRTTTSRVLNILMEVINPLPNALLADQFTAVLLAEILISDANQNFLNQFNAISLAENSYNMQSGNRAIYSKNDSSESKGEDSIFHAKVPEDKQEELRKYLDFCLAKLSLYSPYLTPEARKQLLANDAYVKLLTEESHWNLGLQRFFDEKPEQQSLKRSSEHSIADHPDSPPRKRLKIGDTKKITDSATLVSSSSSSSSSSLSLSSSMSGIFISAPPSSSASNSSSSSSSTSTPSLSSSSSQ